MNKRSAGRSGGALERMRNLTVTERQVLGELILDNRHARPVAHAQCDS